MASNEPDLGEKTLSKIAEVGISSQLDDVEQINVDVRTDPLKLMQGKLDSITIEGEGMVMKQDLRMETIEISTGNVSINPLSVVTGSIELTETTAATARIVLTQADVNRALTSDFLHSKLQGMQVDIQNQTMIFDVQSVHVCFLEQGEMSLDADIRSCSTNEVSHLGAIAKPYIEDRGYRIALRDLHLKETLSPPELTAAVLAKIMELSDLRNFNLPGIELQLTELTIEPGRLILQSATQVEEIPSF